MLRNNTAFSALDTALTLLILLLAGWTLYAHLHVLGERNYLDLQAHWPGLIVIYLLLGGGMWLLSRGRNIITPVTTTPEMTSIRKTMLPLLLAVALVALYGITDSYVTFWIGSMLFLLGYYWHSLKSASELQYVPPAAAPVFLLPACMILATLTSLLVWRIHSDDAFYLNMIVGTLDHPTRPLLSFDDMHGIENFPLLLPVYKVQTIELLIAWLSGLIDTSYLTLRNLWLPALAASIAVGATTLLMRRLLPSRWIEATVTAVLLMLVFTAFSAGLSNYSFGKLQQGKAWLGAILIPLIIAYTIDCIIHRTAYHWYRLALVQIAAVGISLNALYLAPIAMALTLVGCWDGKRASLRTLLIIACTAFYPLTLGFLLYADMRAASPITHDATQELLTNDPELALTLSPLGYFFWLAVLAGWVALTDPARRRLLLGMSTLFMLLFMNPWLTDVWAQHVTGIPTFRRIWWAIPRHLWLALLFTLPLLLLPLKSRWHKAALGLVVLFFAWIVFGYYGSPKTVSMTVDYNAIDYRWPPQAKLPEDRIQLAQRLTSQIPKRSLILAPEKLSRWFVVHREHPYPLVVTENYLDQLATSFGQEEVALRKRLVRYVSGTEHTQDVPVEFAQTMIDRPVKAVILEEKNPWYIEIQAMLILYGFKYTSKDGDYILWVR